MGVTGIIMHISMGRVTSKGMASYTNSGSVFYPNAITNAPDVIFYYVLTFVVGQSGDSPALNPQRHLLPRIGGAGTSPQSCRHVLVH